MSFLGELKRRNVIRMALLYIVAAWVLLQIADVLFDPLGLPAWTFRMVLGLLLLGFPLALIFAWVFEMTPEGLKRERDIDRSASAVAHTGRKMNTVIVVLLIVAIAGLVIDRLIPESGQAPAAATAVTGPERAAADAGTREAAAADTSIAVLPFVNMSGDPDNEYFSDGLSEELLNTLVRLGGLKVTGRTSSFAFKGQSQDLREIGRLLNVANVLEGSVRKAGNRVRITAQLIKTSDGYHLWSDTFDRELDDIFAIQAEIAERVSDALQVTLLGGAGADQPVVVSISHNAQAYEAYLRGMYIWQREPDQRESLDRARAHFEAALALDPGYVDAHWGMFWVWDRMNRNGHVPFGESLAQMQYYAAEIERLAPGSDRALSAASRNALVDYRYELAADYLREAVRKYPGSAVVQAEFAATLATLSRYDEAMEASDVAAKLDPLSLDVMRWRSFIYHGAGNCAGAEEVMHRAMEIEPNVGRFRYYVAMCIYETTGDAARALPYAEAEPLGFAHDTALAILYDALGDRQRAERQMESMLVAYGDSASYQYGQIYAQWGDRDTALAWLENAVKIRDPGVLQATGDRLLIPLRQEPRFQKILRDVGHF
jgi:TolB-like protein/tetratricopeptide (TPR) repeat protein